LRRPTSNRRQLTLHPPPRQRGADAAVDVLLSDNAPCRNVTDDVSPSWYPQRPFQRWFGSATRNIASSPNRAPPRGLPTPGRFSPLRVGRDKSWPKEFVTRRRALFMAPRRMPVKLFSIEELRFLTMAFDLSRTRTRPVRAKPNSGLFPQPACRAVARVRPCNPKYEPYPLFVSVPPAGANDCSCSNRVHEGEDLASALAFVSRRRGAARQSKNFSSTWGPGSAASAGYARLLGMRCTVRPVGERWTGHADGRCE